ncbi:MAG: TIGR03087 family PEP-CTERM/XrtA system glycosyltransferase [Burkholderiaceae bacterium]|nr:TIGR03087 family PEP-CTERM/XrtA system glycosyltransferase [Burkholderiaceae bacterium]
MSNVLFLVHRIPYPPDKGDKIRSYHLLRFLTRNHRVFLGTFVDDSHDAQHTTRVRGLCDALLALPLDARARRVASLSGLLKGQPLSVPYYDSREMRRWVDETIARERIDAVVVFSSTMAQFVAGPRYAGLRRIADFVDVDSDKWKQYAARSAGVRRWIYSREADRLLAYERDIVAQFDATLFVTESEAALMRSLAPESAAKIAHFENGVDTEYFDPAIGFDDPYRSGGPTIVFTGAMDYWPNLEAVIWFAREILPLVRKARPEARFAIVGSNPGDAVRALESIEGVLVTGRVPDVRPYLAHASVAVAPLRIARGVQNKLLEALAMGRRVVCTAAAAQGLHRSPVIAQATAGDAGEFAAKVVEGLAGTAAAAAQRDYAIAHYGWGENLRVIDALLGVAAPALEAA